MPYIKEQLEVFRQTDIYAVNKDKLTDIRFVRIDPALPQQGTERKLPCPDQEPLLF